MNMVCMYIHKKITSCPVPFKFDTCPALFAIGVYYLVLVLIAQYNLSPYEDNYYYFNNLIN